MKVGVLSDTHVPTIMKALPPIIFDIFRDVDLILHAGDIVEMSVLEELGAIAPVEAVAGNMDDSEAQGKLPYKKVITLGRYKAGIIHGKFKIDVQQEMIRKEFGDVDSDRVRAFSYAVLGQSKRRLLSESGKPHG